MAYDKELLALLRLEQLKSKARLEMWTEAERTLRVAGIITLVLVLAMIIAAVVF